MLQVQFRGLRGVMSGVSYVSVSCVGVVGGLFVIPGFVMPGGFCVMIRCAFMIMRGTVVMFRRFFRHLLSPSLRLT